MRTAQARGTGRRRRPPLPLAVLHCGPHLATSLAPWCGAGVGFRREVGAGAVMPPRACCLPRGRRGTGPSRLIGSCTCAPHAPMRRGGAHDAVGVQPCHDSVDHDQPRVLLPFEAGVWSMESRGCRRVVGGGEAQRGAPQRRRPSWVELAARRTSFARTPGRGRGPGAARPGRPGGGGILPHMRAGILTSRRARTHNPAPMPPWCCSRLTE